VTFEDIYQSRNDILATAFSHVSRARSVGSSSGISTLFRRSTARLDVTKRGLLLERPA